MGVDTSRLKDLRNKKNLSQAEVAEILGVAPGTYRNWEQGIRNPDTGMLVKLADFFDCSTDYILGRDILQALFEKTQNYAEAAQMKNDLDKLADLPDDDKQMIEDLIELRYQKWLKEKQKD